MSSDDDFQKTTNEAYTFPASAGSIKKGDVILIKDKPCKVVEVTTSKTGKHGHAKANITAVDIFEDKKAEDSVPTSHNVDCVNVKKVEYDLVNLDGEGNTTLMDDTGEYKEDIVMNPDSDFFKEVMNAFDSGNPVLVTVLSAMGREKIVQYRQEKKD